jgi:hypothetical protein
MAMPLRTEQGSLRARRLPEVSVAANEDGQFFRTLMNELKTAAAHQFRRLIAT